MFDGVPNDQFHQFIASRTSIPINPLSFPLHGNPSFSAAFDPYSSTLHSQALHQLHHQESPNSTKNNIIDGKHVEKYPLISTSLALESERSMDPWSNDEVLALLKVRSSMEIWFPDFTWEHVSRCFYFKLLVYYYINEGFEFQCLFLSVCFFLRGLVTKAN